MYFTLTKTKKNGEKITITKSIIKKNLERLLQLKPRVHNKESVLLPYVYCIKNEPTLVMILIACGL